MINTLYPTSFNLHNNPIKEVVLLLPVSKWGKQRSKGKNNLIKFPQPVQGRTRIQNQVHLTPEYTTLVTVLPYTVGWGHGTLFPSSLKWALELAIQSKTLLTGSPSQCADSALKMYNNLLPLLYYSRTNGKISICNVIQGLPWRVNISKVLISYSSQLSSSAPLLFNVLKN